MKKKNYLTLFLAYCRRNEIWFSVGVDSCIQCCTCLQDGFQADFEPGVAYKLGSKAAFEWVKAEMKEIREDA